MPQFIKMGLGGTGFRGKPGSHDRAAQRRARRRKVLEGFPITRAFESIKEVRDYLSGDRVVCLLCGKTFKALGIHLLRIHEMTVDEYRERYRIPWSYGVLSKTSHDIRCEILARRMREGFNPGIPAAELAALTKNVLVRECPYQAEIARQNVAKANTRNMNK